MDLEPSIITWILLIFGWIFIAILILFAQGVMLLRPKSKAARDLIIAKGENWRDKTHFKSAYGLAIADILFWIPVLVVGSAGVVMGELWGYVLWSASAAISVYISIYLWTLEKEYVYPRAGFWRYYTYIWGFFLYWGVAVIVHTLIIVA